MSAIANPTPAAASGLEIEATVTSKGQITIPVELRTRLGLKAGDKITFKTTAEGVTLSRKREENRFEQFRGCWGDILPEGYEGREGVVRFMREMRGHDEYDDRIFGTEA